MSFRHEDFPCCGCGPEGCVDTTRTVSCQDCGKTYHPDQNTGVYCYACLDKPRKPDIVRNCEPGVCADCNEETEDNRTSWDGDELCEECYDERRIGYCEGRDSERDE